MKIAMCCVVLAAAVPLATPALAFDCGRAQTKVEKAICADPKLKAVDDQLNAAYDKLVLAGDSGTKAALQISQVRWIRSRENCAMLSDAEMPSCIRESTNSRHAVLTARPQSGPGDGSDLTPWFVQKDGKKGDWDIGLDLVRFAQPQTDGEQLFNRDVEALAAPSLLENSTLGTATEKVPKDRIFALSVTLTPTFASKHMISALAQGFEDRGGAHPNTWSRAINIALDGGRRLAFGDLFPRESIGLFAKLCSDQLIAERRDGTGDPKINLEEGADEVIVAHIKNLDTWYFRDSKAVILFDPYQIGSYAEGAYGCELEMPVLKAHAVAGAVLP